MLRNQICKQRNAGLRVAAPLARVWRRTSAAGRGWVYVPWAPDKQALGVAD